VLLTASRTSCPRVEFPPPSAHARPRARRGSVSDQQASDTPLNRGQDGRDGHRFTDAADRCAIATPPTPRVTVNVCVLPAAPHVLRQREVVDPDRGPGRGVRR